MTSTINLNQNAVECLHKVKDFGGTAIVNICNGAETYVSWGSLNWTFCFFGGVLFVGLAVTILLLVSSMISDIFP